MMETFVILRRGAWNSADELGEAAARSTKVGDEEMSDDIRWLRSYVLTRIVPVADTVIVRPDPEPSHA